MLLKMLFTFTKVTNIYTFLIIKLLVNTSWFQQKSEIEEWFKVTFHWMGNSMFALKYRKCPIRIQKVQKFDI